MGIAELLSGKREQILTTVAKHGARKVRVFGSVARGDAGPSSDVDFLVDMSKDHSLMERAALLVDLEGLLGRPVDVVTPRSLRPGMRARVLKEAVLL